MTQRDDKDGRQWGEGPEGDSDVMAYINQHHLLMSLLYDLDLLPEQHMGKPRDGKEWCSIFAITNHWREAELARSSCAAQEPIPEHYSLDEVAARTLRDWLNDGDGGLNDVTIHVGRGHGGPGLYVSLTEYPEEGAALLVEAPQNESRSAAAKPSAGTGS